MLHPTNCPACRALLETVLDFERKVLELALARATSIPPTQAECEKALGKAGRWFHRRLKGRKQGSTAKASELGAALMGLMEIARASEPGFGARILAAFDHDRAFHVHAGEAGFTFGFAALDASLQAALKDLCGIFYTKLLADGFPAEVHGGTGKLDRDGFLASFEQTNPWLEVCPACDGQKPSQLEQRSLADADHYLPKSQYPFLSIHPLNLVPTCLECNQRVKRAKDPVDAHDAEPLRNTFLPYVAPAIDQVAVQVSRDGAGALKLALVEQNGNPSRRVSSLDRVFELQARWKDRLAHEIEMVRQDVAEAGRRLAEDSTERDKRRLRREVELRPDELARRLGQRPFMLAQASYRAFAVSDEDELDVLMSYFAAS
jgi:hypothetical protein